MPGRLSALSMTVPPSASMPPFCLFLIWSVMALPSASYISEAALSSMATDMRPSPEISNLTASQPAKTTLPSGATILPSFSIAPAISTPKPPSRMVILPSLTRSLSTSSLESFLKRYSPFRKSVLAMSRVESMTLPAVAGSAFIVAAGPTYIPEVLISIKRPLQFKLPNNWLVLLPNTLFKI